MLFAQQLAYGNHLVLGQKLGHNIRNAEGAPDGLADALGVAGQEHGLFDACVVQLAYGVLCAVLDPVIDDDITVVNAAGGDVNDGQMPVGAVALNSVRVHKRRVADENASAVNIGFNAASGKLAHVCDMLGIDDRCARSAQRKRDRVV